MTYLRFDMIVNGNFKEAGYSWSNKTDNFPFYRNDGKEYESDTFYKITNEGISFKEDII